MQEIHRGAAAFQPLRDRGSGETSGRLRFVDVALPLTLRTGIAMNAALAVERFVAQDFRSVAGAVVVVLAWLVAERLEAGGSRRAACVWAAGAAVVVGPIWAAAAPIGLVMSTVWLVVLSFLAASEVRFSRRFVIGLIVIMVTAWVLAVAATGATLGVADPRAQLQLLLIVVFFALAAAVLHRRMAAVEARNRLSMTSTRRDPETGLLRRSAMLEVIQREVARSRRSGRAFALMITGVDGLDELSRRRGPECAKWVMVTLTDLMRKIIRCEDRLARWDNDRLLLLLHETDVEGAQAAARRLHSEVRRSAFVFDGTEIGFSVTMVTAAGDGRLDLDACSRTMQTALSEHQEAGGDRVAVVEDVSSG